MRKQFLEKNYRMQFYDNFFRTFSNSIYSVFAPVILYKAGVSVTAIIAIFALQFLIMGILTPLCGILSRKIGVADTKFLSYLLKTISMIIVLYVNTNIYYYIAIAVIYGLSGAINNPLNTYIPGVIVDEKYRGRFNSFAYILRAISSILGYFFVGIFLTKDNNVAIAILVFISYFISYISLLNIDKNKLKYETKSSFKESYNYLFKNKDNKKLKLVSGFRSCIIIERLITVPLYIYIFFQDIKTFTFMYISSTVVELVALFITGNKLDKRKPSTFNIVSAIKGIITLVFLFIKNSFVLMINQFMYKLVDNVYDSAYSALSQSKVENDKKDTMLLSMIHEMCLCFFEFVILTVFVIVSIINVNLTFKAMFISSIIVIVVNAKLVRGWNKEK